MPIRRPAQAADETIPPPAFVLAGGSVALLVATVAATELRMPTNTALVMLALIAAAASIRTSAPVAVSLAVIAWLLLVGFVVNRLGELRIHSREDWFRLGLLVASSSVVAFVTRRRRAVAAPARPGLF